MIKKKLKQKKGETLAETLLSLLIIVPGMVMLAGALVSSSKINMEMKKADTLKFPTFTAATETSITSTVTGDAEFSGKPLKWEKETGSAYYYIR